MRLRALLLILVTVKFEVFGRGHLFKMSWVEAVPTPACVMDMMTFHQDTACCLVDKTMKQHRLSLVFHFGISAMAVPCPHPTLTVRNDFVLPPSVSVP